MVLCYFGINRNAAGITKARHKGTDLEGITCSETMSSIVESLGGLKKPYDLHGCDTLIEVLLLRANGETSFDLQEEGKRSICNNHLKFLLTSWPDKTYHQRRNVKRSKSQPSACALTHGANRPLATTRIFRKDDVLLWMDKFNELVHLGTAVCTDHSKELSTLQILADPVCEVMQQEDVDEADPIYNLGSRSAPSEDSEMEEECSEVTDLMLALLAAMGEKRIVTRGSWDSISPPTRGHKLRVVTRLVDQACKTICPDGYLEMKKELIEKVQLSRTKEKDCFSSVMESVALRLSEANSRTERISILSWIVDLPVFNTSKVLLTLPGVTKHTIQRARLYNRGGIDLDAKYVKVRYNARAIAFFISFLVRANVLQTLPWVDNVAELSDGSKISLASTVRLQTYARIDRLYRSELKRLNIAADLWLSEGTVYKILNAIVPRKNRRMLCVDEYSVDAIQSWDVLSNGTNELFAMGHLGEQDKTDILRRLRLARVFYECEYRTHLSSKSTILDHCTTFALSDKKNKIYRAECDHEHTTRCRECVEAASLPSIIIEKISAALEVATEGQRGRLVRLMELAQRSDRLLLAYRSHLVRGVIADEAKVNYIDSMKDGECLVTADWAMKVLPSGPLEGQSGWYAKAGNSLHVSHALAKINSRLMHHTFYHIVDCCTQDSPSVAAILADVRADLAHNGISTVALRSDNAGCFKNQSLLATLAAAASAKPRIDHYSFSESQMGKGPSDRMTAHGKRVIREYVEGGEECMDCEQIYKALTGQPVKATSAIHCRVESFYSESTEIKDISKLFYVKFTDTGLTAYKHFGIGDGQKLKKNALNPLNCSLDVISKGGFTGGDTFWGSLEHTDEMKIDCDPKNTMISDPVDNRILPCSTPGCIKSYMTERRLEEHEVLGKHVFKEYKETLLDNAIRQFSTAIETQEAARIAVCQDAFSGDRMDESKKPLEGWALKVTTRSTIPKNSRDYAVKFFDRHRKMIPPRRASPRELCKEMENAMKDGKYIFKVTELYSEKQLTSLFSRLEKQRVGGEVKPNKEGTSETATQDGKVRRGKDKVAEIPKYEEFDQEEDEYEFVSGCIEEGRSTIFE